MKRIEDFRHIQLKLANEYNEERVLGAEKPMTANFSAMSMKMARAAIEKVCRIKSSMKFNIGVRF